MSESWSHMIEVITEIEEVDNLAAMDEERRKCQ